MGKVVQNTVKHQEREETVRNLRGQKLSSPFLYYYMSWFLDMSHILFSNLNLVQGACFPKVLQRSHGNYTDPSMKQWYGSCVAFLPDLNCILYFKTINISLLIDDMARQKLKFQAR